MKSLYLKINGHKAVNTFFYPARRFCAGFSGKSRDYYKFPFKKIRKQNIQFCSRVLSLTRYYPYHPQFISALQVVILGSMQIRKCIFPQWTTSFKWFQKFLYAFRKSSSQKRHVFFRYHSRIFGKKAIFRVRKSPFKQIVPFRNFQKTPIDLDCFEKKTKI